MIFLTLLVIRLALRKTITSKVDTEMLCFFTSKNKEWIVFSTEGNVGFRVLRKKPRSTLLMVRRFKYQQVSFSDNQVNNSARTTDNSTRKLLCIMAVYFRNIYCANCFLKVLLKWVIIYKMNFHIQYFFNVRKLRNLYLSHPGRRTLKTCLFI